MRVNPYLNFDGDCRTAFEFYARCLGGTIEAMLTHRGSPMEAQTPPEWLDKVMHARLIVDGTVLMGSDSPPEYFQRPQGFQVTINLDDPAKADRVFAALAEGGEVRMPIQETFWAKRFGMLTDRFGIPWMVNCQAAA
jgi:PhnB protein